MCLRALDVQRRILLKWILEKQSVTMRIGFIWLITGSSKGFCTDSSNTIGFTTIIDDHVDVGENVSKLRPQVGLLFIRLVTCEHGKLWWNDVDREKLLTLPPECSPAILPAETSSSKSGASGRRKLWLLHLFHTRRELLAFRKILRMGPAALLLLRRNKCCEFL
jgi:hypothetical protein